MSLESSVSFWDALSFWLITAGVVLTFVGCFASIMFRRYNHELVLLAEEQNRQEKQAADKSIADAGARAAEANAHAKEAEARAAKAQLELAKFKAPRTLSADQQQIIIDKLKEYVGQTFSLNVNNDRESVALLQTITGILKAAGWTEIRSQISDVAIGDAGVVTETGIKCEVPQNAGPILVERVKRLDSALNEEGITSLPRYNIQLRDPSAINVVVGGKP